MKYRQWIYRAHDELTTNSNKSLHYNVSFLLVSCKKSRNRRVVEASQSIVECNVQRALHTVLSVQRQSASLDLIEVTSELA